MTSHFLDFYGAASHTIHSYGSCDPIVAIYSYRSCDPIVAASTIYSYGSCDPHLYYTSQDEQDKI